MKTKYLILAAIVIIAILIGGYILFQPKSVEEITVEKILSNPEKYNGSKVGLQGKLSKTVYIFGMPTLLMDKTGEIPVASPTINLDSYTGLEVDVTGTVYYRPGITDVPETLIEIETLDSEEPPGFFVQWTKTGGIAGFDRVIIIDNKGAMYYYDHGQFAWKYNLNETQIETVRNIIIENGFFSEKQGNYTPASGAADYFSFSLKATVRINQELENNNLHWVDYWASVTPLPQSIMKMQNTIDEYFNKIRFSETDGLTLELATDRSVVKLGETLTCKVTLTNIGEINRTFQLGLPIFDLILYSENGSALARWSDGRPFIMIVVFKELAPRESYSEELTWNLYIYDSRTGEFNAPSPGKYYLAGFFWGQPHIETVKVPVKVR